MRHGDTFLALKHASLALKKWSQWHSKDSEGVALKQPWRASMPRTVAFPRVKRLQVAFSRKSFRGGEKPSHEGTESTLFPNSKTGRQGWTQDMVRSHETRRSKVSIWKPETKPNRRGPDPQAEDHEVQAECQKRVSWVVCFVGVCCIFVVVCCWFVFVWLVWCGVCFVFVCCLWLLVLYVLCLFVCWFALRRGLPVDPPIFCPAFPCLKRRMLLIAPQPYMATSRE